MSPVTRIARFIIKLHHDNRGVAAIEFALCSTVLLFLLMGTVDLGFALRHRNQLENAVRDGLQRALIEGTQLQPYDDYEDAVEALVTGAPGLPTTPAPTSDAILECRCVTTSGGSVTEAGTNSGTIDDGTNTGNCAASACTSPAVMYHFVEITATQQHDFILGLPMVANPTTMTVIKDIKIPVSGSNE